MRNLASEQPADLFSQDGPVLTAVELEAAQAAGRTPERIARDFVRWCTGLGAGFRNSPDVGNLRYWAAHEKLQLDETDERAIVEESRRLMLKKIEQLIGKAEVPPLTADLPSGS